MTEGWIKIHRKLMTWEWYNDSNMVHLFLHLLLSANHSGGKWQGIDIKRGQLITGRIKLSAATGISEQSVRTCLKKLEKTKELTIKSTNKNSVITLLNYDSYQIKESANQQLTSNQPATNQQLTTNKNEKKDNNDNNDNIIFLIKEKTKITNLHDFIKEAFQLQLGNWNQLYPNIGLKSVCDKVFLEHAGGTDITDKQHLKNILLKKWKYLNNGKSNGQPENLKVYPGTFKKKNT